MTLDERVAIIGMHVKLPMDINTTGELWQLLMDGRDVFRRGPISDGHAAITSYITDSHLFAADHFGVSSFEAELTDPQHRLLLEMCWECLASVASGQEQITGVFAACSPSSFLEEVLLGHPDLWERNADQIIVGSHPDFLATRIAYLLNLTGPAMQIGTGCSSSLVALSQAVQALNTFQCDRALVAAASVRNEPGYDVRQGSINSPDGHCRPFSDAANGIVPGNGVAVVLLKRLEDAIADRDQVHAVINGSAVNNDGRRKVGFLAPSVEGQYECIVAALDDAQVDPAQVCYVEAHGTGTVVGDPIELRALSRAYGPGRERFVGSIKANIGHCDAAAGLFGLIKAAMVLEKGIVPRQINVGPTTSKHDWSRGGLSVAQTNTDLAELVATGVQLTAAVSSLGVGGTNAHVLLTDTRSFAKPTVAPMGRPIVRLTGRKVYGIGPSRHEPTQPAVPVASEMVTAELLFEMFSAHTSDPVVSLDDSYFERGGDSIGLIYLLEELSEVAGRAIPLELFMGTPTVSFVKDYLTTTAAGTRTGPSVEPDDVSTVEAGISARLGGLGIAAGDALPPAGDANVVLLTGATGFVGTFVLAELLSRGAEVICLVRGSAARRDELIASMRGLGLARAEDAASLTVVEGDIGEPQLGLDGAVYLELCGRVGRVMHCGAWVNHLYHYAQLAPVNTDSAAELLAFAATTRRKSLTFVSTSAVFGDPSPRERSEIGATALTSFPPESDGYGRSKAIAEAYFMRAGELGVPAVIVRIPSIFGDRKRFQINAVDTVWSWVRAIIASGHHPAGFEMPGNEFFQALPGDIAARVIVESGYPTDTPGCRIINAIPNLVCSTRGLLAGLSTAGHRTEPLPDHEWYGLVAKLGAREVWVAALAADIARTGNVDMPPPLPRFCLHDNPEVSELVNSHAIWSPSDLAGYIAGLPERTLLGSLG